MNYSINTDGASRGNPGRASYGFVIKTTDGVILHQEGRAIGIETNNVAEYRAVLAALFYLKTNVLEDKKSKVEVITDSLLIASQLAGKFKIKNENLKKIYSKIKSLEEEIGEIEYKHVLREKNYLADRLANQALDREKV